MTDTPSADPAHPSSIGGFEVRRVLGQGGMGRVYGCWDKELEREVAIKVLLAELAVQDDMSQRFVREARAMAKILSPHVVVVHQVGTDELGPFLVMELLEGEDLSSLIKRQGALPLAQVIELTQQAIAGLKTAADAGLVHRDVKPENLFVTPAGVKLTDFGLARPLDGSENLTQAGLVVGSPHYLAPELARGKEATVQSDLYALGATLFEMITGKPPYRGGTPVEIITAHMMSDVPSVKATRPDVPDALAALVGQLLSKEPAQRPTSYDAVAAVLEHVAPLVASSAADAAAGTKVLGSPSAATGLLGEALDEPSVGDGTSATAVVDDKKLRSSKVSGALPTVKTDTLAIMFTDLAGYTQRTGMQSREEAAYWLELHDALLKPVFRAFKGSVVKTIGDAFLVTFKSPTDAVLCGCAIQDRLFAHNRSASADDRIDVRVAISVGEVRLRKGDVLGEPVNLAARLEGMADKGEVIFSDAVYATMNAAEVPADDRGEHELKGIQRKVRVYAARTVPGSGPPFGGTALARVNDGGFEAAIDAAKRRLAGAVNQVSEGIGEVATPANAAGMKKLAIAAGAVLAIVAVGLSAFTLIDGLGNKADDPISEWSIKELAAYLSDKNIGDIKAELKRRDPDDLEDDLEGILKEGNWIARHNALDILEDVKVATDEHRTVVAIEDLKAANTCKRKMVAVRTLKKVADRGAALDAFDATDFAGCKVPDGTREAIEKAIDEH